ncbi:MAG: hypothetical protein LBR89_04985, partial [Holosporales bacterium]|nr:hypothetical protein [Holosporales bacterium]
KWQKKTPKTPSHTEPASPKEVKRENREPKPQPALSREEPHQYSYKRVLPREYTNAPPEADTNTIVEADTNTIVETDANTIVELKNHTHPPTNADLNLRIVPDHCNNPMVKPEKFVDDGYTRGIKIKRRKFLMKFSKVGAKMHHEEPKEPNCAAIPSEAGGRHDEGNVVSFSKKSKYVKDPASVSSNCSDLLNSPVWSDKEYATLHMGDEHSRGRWRFFKRKSHKKRNSDAHSERDKSEDSRPGFAQKHSLDPTLDAEHGLRKHSLDPTFDAEHGRRLDSNIAPMLDAATIKSNKGGDLDFSDDGAHNNADMYAPEEDPDINPFTTNDQNFNPFITGDPNVAQFPTNDPDFNQFPTNGPDFNQFTTNDGCMWDGHNNAPKQERSNLELIINNLPDTEAPPSAHDAPRSHGAVASFPLFQQPGESDSSPAFAPNEYPALTLDEGSVSCFAISETGKAPIIIPFRKENNAPHKVLPPLMPDYRDFYQGVTKVPVITEERELKAKKHRNLTTIFVSAVTCCTLAAMYLSYKYKEQAIDMWQNVNSTSSRNVASSTDQLALEHVSYTLVPDKGVNAKITVVGEVVNNRDYSLNVPRLKIRIYSMTSSKVITHWEHKHSSLQVLPNEHSLFRSEKRIRLSPEERIRVEVAFAQK